MLLERHPTVVSRLVEVTARCGVALMHTRKLFSKRCLESLGVFLRSGGAAASAAKASLESIVIPALAEISQTDEVCGPAKHSAVGTVELV